MNIVAPDRAASTWMISFTDSNRSSRLIHKPLFSCPSPISNTQEETLMPTLPINGAQLRVRMVEIELDRLKLDPDNPRLHTAYLTHAAAHPAERNPDYPGA